MTPDVILKQSYNYFIKEIMQCKKMKLPGLFAGYNLNIYMYTK